MNGDPALDDARARAIVARRNFRAAASDAFSWFSPERLKAEAAEMATHQIDGAKAALRHQVRRHPLISWSAMAIGATVITYLLRWPIAALAHGGARAWRSLRTRL